MLNDFQIIKLCSTSTGKMIEPFVDRKTRENNGVPCLSYGVDSFGYDIRMNPEGIRYMAAGRLIDPFNMDERAFPFLHPARMGENKFGKYIDLYHGEGILGKSIERFNMPKTVKGVCLGKSTYARGFIANLTTPLEAGWSGYLTIEVVNAGQGVARVYVGNHGILSITFFQGDLPIFPYGEGKYQNQGNEVVLPRAYSAADYDIAEEQFADEIGKGYNLIGDPLDDEF